MLTLCLDTTAKTASVALCEDGRLLCEFSVNDTLTHSENLIYMIDAAFKCCGKAPKELERAAICAGPGSFTGVRIGSAALKGLCFGKNIPIAAVSTLEALAYNVNSGDTVICSAMDARREQTYFAVFSLSGGVYERQSEDAAASLDEACEKVREICLKIGKNQVIFVGDGAHLCYNRFIGEENFEVKAFLADERSRYQSAASLAAAAERYFEEGKTVSDLTLDCVYLRKPQADMGK